MALQLLEKVKQKLNPFIQAFQSSPLAPQKPIVDPVTPQGQNIIANVGRFLQKTPKFPEQQVQKPNIIAPPKTVFNIKPAVDFLGDTIRSYGNTLERNFDPVEVA